MEEAGASGRDEVQAHAVRASGLTRNRHVVGIASKGRNVIANPRQRGTLIEKSIVSRRFILGDERGMAEKPKRSETIVWRDDDCASQRRQLLPILRREVGRCGSKGTRMEPDDHRCA